MKLCKTLTDMQWIAKTSEALKLCTSEEHHSGCTLIKEMLLARIQFMVQQVVLRRTSTIDQTSSA